jgi:hypothetical protein
MAPNPAVNDHVNNDRMRFTLRVIALFEQLSKQTLGVRAGGDSLPPVAVILNTKPRIRLPDSDPAAAIKTRRAQSWLPYAIVLWVLASVSAHGIHFGWLPVFAKSSRHPAERRASDEVITLVQAAPQAMANATVNSVPRAPMLDVHGEPHQAVDPASLPSCESISNDSAEPTEPGDLLPVNLARTPVGSLLNTPNFIAPCRGVKPTRVHLCLAIKNGNVLGATVRAEPHDNAVEQCVVRVALRVPLEPEYVLRKVQLDLDVPADRRR